jgi:catechol 2,3-dioxygenase-like lactoylglutathione lyase family enzyme
MCVHAGTHSVGVMPAALDPNKTAVDLGFVIRDSKATLDFYCGLLGLEHVMDMPIHRIQAGATTLKFQRLDDTPADSNPAGGPATATGMRYFTIWITNLDALIEECRAAGAVVAVAPSTIRPGVRIAFLIDPDGIWVELLESTPV